MRWSPSMSVAKSYTGLLIGGSLSVVFVGDIELREHYFPFSFSRKQGLGAQIYTYTALTRPCSPTARRQTYSPTTNTSMEPSTTDGRGCAVGSPLNLAEGRYALCPTVSRPMVFDPGGVSISWTT